MLGINGHRPVGRTIPQKVLAGGRRLFLVCLIAMGPCPWLPAAERPFQTVEVLSPLYTVDRKYESMEGPRGERQVLLLQAEQPELLWVVGGRVELTGPDGKGPLPSSGFLCHSSLHLDTGQMSAEEHNRLFGGLTKPLLPHGKFLGFSQGVFSTSLPSGFGVPLLSTETLILEEMLLNQHAEEPVSLRLKWTVEFARDRDLAQPLKPLFARLFVGHLTLEGRDSPHWMIKPGREVRRFPVTHRMELPYDTTIHHLWAHLHAFGESVALRDVTTDTTLFTSHATSYPDRVGIAQMEVFSSEAGLPVYKDHEYELVSVYHNTSGMAQRGMVGVYLYLLDHAFEKPRLVHE